MKLENWMYRRDVEEYILSFPELFSVSPTDIAQHRSNQEEAEQEIETEMRR